MIGVSLCSLCPYFASRLIKISNYFDLLFFCSQVVVNLKNIASWLAFYLHCSYKSSKPFLKASAFVIECALANSTSFSCSSFDSLTEILLTFGLSIFGLPIFAIPLPPINSYYTLWPSVSQPLLNCIFLRLFLAIKFSNYSSSNL